MVWIMKFNAVLMTLDQNTKIRLVVTMYGMKFSSEHYPEYYLDHKHSPEGVAVESERSWLFVNRVQWNV